MRSVFDYAYILASPFSLLSPGPPSGNYPAYGNVGADEAAGVGAASD